MTALSTSHYPADSAAQVLLLPIQESTSRQGTSIVQYQSAPEVSDMPTQLESYSRIFPDPHYCDRSYLAEPTTSQGRGQIQPWPH
jgi:hypothetical protein